MRARNIKPSFFKNPDLGECSPQARLGFIGLWCMADREGRVLDRAKLVKAELFPYDNIDTEAILCELASCGLIKRYEAKGLKIIWIVNFARHQSPHFKEKASELPAFSENPGQAPGKPQASPDPGQCQHPLNPDSGLLNPECGTLNPESGLLNPDSCTEPEEPASVPVADQEPVPPLPFDPTTCRYPTFPCSGDAKTWQATSDQLGAWQEAYPGIDVNAEHRKAHAWIMANLTKRKTATGYAKYLNSWMARAQDSGGRASPIAPQQKTFAQMKQENTDAAFMRVFGDDTSAAVNSVVEGTVRRISGGGNG